VTVGAVIAAVLALFGASGLVYWVVNYRRDDTGKVIGQWNESVTAQNQVLEGWRALHKDLQDALDRTRAERNDLAEEVRRCREQIASLEARVEALQTEVHVLTSALEHLGSGHA
jgi:chromosome segregation ATPase